LSARRAAIYFAAATSDRVREFFYGVVLGAAAMYCFQYFDAPGILAYLNNATQAAVKSTHGYSH
jgi:hypothetical protein